MIDYADAIVIGSGGLGAATAFYLARRGTHRVVIVDKHEIGSQTSPRAAGMVSYVRKSDLMIELVKLAGQNIRRFSGQTEQPLTWVHSGSLKIARRSEDAKVIEADILRARRHGLDVEQLSPSQAQELNPFLRTDDVVAAM